MGTLRTMRPAAGSSSPAISGAGHLETDPAEQGRLAWPAEADMIQAQHAAARRQPARGQLEGQQLHPLDIGAGSLQGLLGLRPLTFGEAGQLAPSRLGPPLHRARDNGGNASAGGVAAARGVAASLAFARVLNIAPRLAQAALSCVQGLRRRRTLLGAALGIEVVAAAIDADAKGG
jgi:hypothetical protein